MIALRARQVPNELQAYPHHKQLRIRSRCHKEELRFPALPQLSISLHVGEAHYLLKLELKIESPYRNLRVKPNVAELT